LAGQCLSRRTVLAGQHPQVPVDLDIDGNVYAELVHRGDINKGRGILKNPDLDLADVEPVQLGQHLRYAVDVRDDPSSAVAHQPYLRYRSRIRCTGIGSHSRCWSNWTRICSTQKLWTSAGMLRRLYQLITVAMQASSRS